MKNLTNSIVHASLTPNVYLIYQSLICASVIKTE